MSDHHALQRAIVRCLYDPKLVARLHQGARLPALDANQHKALLAVPALAWRTDPYRRARTLQSLLDEYAVSAAVVGLGPLDAFFGSTGFHDCIQGRGSLALAFGDWLIGRSGPLATLDRAICLARRFRPPPPAPTTGPHLVCARGLVPVALPEGTLTAWQGVRQVLGADPLGRLAQQKGPLAPRPSLPQHLPREYWLVQADAQGHTSLAPGAEGLHAVLIAAGRPATGPFLRGALEQQGCTAAEATDLLQEFLDEGLLHALP